MCLHTILQHPTDADRLYIAISAAGAFRTADGGETWQPINKGLRSGEIPDQDSEVGHCVHNLAMHPDNPDVLYMQKHWDVMRTKDGGDSWHEVSGNLPTDFGFPIAGARPRAGDHLRRADHQRLPPLPARGQAAGLPQPHRWRRVGGADQGPAAGRTATSTCCATRWPSTAHESCGVYFGTTGGQVYASNDSGDTWAPIVRDLPAVLSVEVQTLP